MPIPNYISTVQRLASEHPQEWRNAHTGNANTEDFIRRLAWVLHQMDPRCGLNGKRGNPLDISDDVIAIKGEGSAVDVVNGGPMEIIDVIARAGAPDQAPAWQIGPGGPGDRGTWVKPEPVGVIVQPKPCPDPARHSKPDCPDLKAHDPKPPVPYPDENTFWRAYEESVVAAYAAKGRQIDSQSFRWFTRVSHDIAAHGLAPDVAAAKHLAALKQALG